jgi:zinc transport system substrate-binding protein
MRAEKPHEMLSVAAEMLRILTTAARIRAALTLAAVSVGFAGAALAKPPLILTSNKPIYGLTAFLMRSAGTPTLLLDGNPYLRTKPLNVDETALLQRGRLVIWLGPGLEPYLVAPLKQSRDTVESLPMIRTPGVRLLARGSGAVAAARTQRSARKARAKVAVKKSRDGRRTIVIPRDGGAVDTGRRRSGQARKAKPAYTPRTRQITRSDLRPRNPDPHIWMDPRNAIAMARHISRTLIRLDPKNGRIYRRNLARLIVHIETLDAETRASLQAIAPGRYAIIDAKTRYYESHYLLRPSSRLSLKMRKPDRNTIALVRARLAQEGSRCIYGGTSLTSNIRRRLGNRANAIVILDPYGLDVPADEHAYFAIVAGVTKRFVRCLDPQQPTR